jgi:hypothetical protein
MFPLTSGNAGTLLVFAAERRREPLTVWEEVCGVGIDMTVILRH